MVERPMPNNFDVPGKQIQDSDFGSRYPISKEDHKLFETEVGRLGICVCSSRMSLDVKDPKIGSEDAAYMKDISYVEQQVYTIILTNHQS